MVTSDRVFDKLEEAALGALEDYHAYRTYQGENEKYYKRAKLGIPVLSTYGRVRGTRANERQLDIIERRIASGDMTPVSLPALAAESDQQDTSSPDHGNGAEPDADSSGARKRPRK